MWQPTQAAVSGSNGKMGMAMGKMKMMGMGKMKMMGMGKMKMSVSKRGGGSKQGGGSKKGGGGSKKGGVGSKKGMPLTQAPSHGPTPTRRPVSVDFIEDIDQPDSPDAVP
jgi:hypothetical protein